MTEPALGPSGPGSVILEVGGDVGALVLETPPGLAGAEIEISPADGGARTHSAVRPRHTPAGTRHAAVYPALPAGDYIIWQLDGSPAGQVTVRGGQASRFSWPDTAGAAAEVHAELSAAVMAAAIPAPCPGSPRPSPSQSRPPEKIRRKNQNTLRMSRKIEAAISGAESSPRDRRSRWKSAAVSPAKMTSPRIA